LNQSCPVSPPLINGGVTGADVGVPLERRHHALEVERLRLLPLAPVQIRRKSNRPASGGGFVAALRVRVALVDENLQDVAGGRVLSRGYR